MAKFETHLSLSSLDEMIKRYDNRKKNYPKIAMRIADRLANEMLEDVKNIKTEPYGSQPYKDSKKKETRPEGNVATSGIIDETKKAFYNEFGTGVKGTGTGKKGWWYPFEDEAEDIGDKNTNIRELENGDIIAYSTGLKATKGYQKALEKAEERFKEVGEEELQKEV